MKQIIFKFALEETVVKVTIAKILSLFTVLLLSSNIALSSVPSGTFRIVETLQKSSGNSKFLSNSNDVNSSVIVFNFEKDNFEDFEWIADLPEEGISFVLFCSFENEPIICGYEGYFSFKQKVPRWLLVRHILI